MFDRFDDLLRSHFEKRFAQGLISSYGNIVVNAGGIDLAVAAEYDSFLALIEGDIPFTDDLFPAGRIQRVEEPVDHISLEDCFGNDLGNILSLYVDIADHLRPDYNQRSPLAKTMASGSLNLHLFP